MVYPNGKIKMNTPIGGVAGMKLLDDVRVVNDHYKEQGVPKGMIGTIIEADIRWDSFFVIFQDQRVYDNDFAKTDIFKLKDDICLGIKIKDLELVKDSHCDDETIRNSLPEKHKDQWCKVENGFIINLAGKKKNKIAYDYNS